MRIAIMFVKTTCMPCCGDCPEQTRAERCRADAPRQMPDSPKGITLILTGSGAPYLVPKVQLRFAVNVRMRMTPVTATCATK